MRKQAWLTLFVIDALLHLVAITTAWHWAALVTKALLIPFMLVWFLQIVAKRSWPRFFITAALFFSWLGDVFLLEVDSPQFFIAGLVSFLIAHTCYIFFFIKVIRSKAVAVKWNIFIILSVLLYAILLFAYLMPDLGSMKVPVFLYAITIAVMLTCAIHAFKNSSHKQTYFCIAGAALFVLSDSLLAINKFATPFASASFYIMLTYILAQYCIVSGAAAYLSYNNHTFENSIIKKV